MGLVVEVQIEDAAWRKAWPRAAADARRLINAAAQHIQSTQNSSSWPGLTRPPRGAARKTARVALGGRVKPGHDDVLGLDGLEVAVALASDARLKELNGRFRGKDRPTNVLSFENPHAPLGGIALAFETVFREAKAQRKPFVNHSKHLILHGFLHLLGHDHHTARDARLMEGLEIAILASMGIPNPYLLKATRRA